MIIIVIIIVIIIIVIIIVIIIIYYYYSYYYIYSHCFRSYPWFPRTIRQPRLPPKKPPSGEPRLRAVEEGMETRGTCWLILICHLAI